MVTLEALDAFLSLIQRLIGLSRMPTENRRRMFFEVVEPLFLELQPVVDDYFTLFRTSRELIRTTPRSNLNRAVKEISESRDRMLRARIQIVELAEKLSKETKDKRLRTFCEKIVTFFRVIDINVASKMSVSKSRGLVVLCEYVVRDDLDEQLLVIYISKTLRFLEESWVAIAQSYAALRVHCLK